MHRGYIKIWRRTLDSGLLQLPNTLALFVYMLMEATHKPIRYGTVELERGQLVTGRHKLSSELKMSEQSVRTALEHLIKFDFITSKATNKYTIYTIVNYNKYQDADVIPNQQNNHQVTNEQPTSNQQVTTIQEHKHINTKEVKPLSAKPDVIEVLEYLNEKANRNYKPVEANAKFVIARLNEGATVDDLKRVIDAKVSEWGSDAKWSKYLRPATLFNAEKFAQYSGETSKAMPVGKFDVKEWLKTK